MKIDTIVSSLHSWKLTTPNKAAFVQLDEGCIAMTYSELSDAVSSKQFQILNSLEANLKESADLKAVLLFTNSIEFITTFLACQGLGITPVPMFYPRSKRFVDRLNKVLDDLGNYPVFCHTADVDFICKGLKDRDSLVVGVESVKVDRGGELICKKSDHAFIQYTSGSTGAPKGVVISHQNLQHNLELIKSAFGCDKDSRILSWLPFYHDMGLVGNLLHSIYVGCTCYLLNPSSVMQAPLSWLNHISNNKITHSGGPNFIYEKCVKSENSLGPEVDLSSWKVAYNGSEPVRYSTVKSFVDRFSKNGFKSTSIMPCYGLAECTLLVSAGSIDLNEEKITSGKIAGDLEVVFYDESNGVCNSNEGEICVHGGSVTEGYWKRNNESLFVIHQNKKYLRTGDFGSLTPQGLSIEGRIKEMIIVNGKNFYPYDIETVIGTENQALDSTGVVLVADETVFPPELFVFAEVKRAHLKTDLNLLINQIDAQLIKELGMKSKDIVLLSPLRIPRTSSGKLQRVKSKELYQSGDLGGLMNKLSSIKNESLISKGFDPEDPEQINEYLKRLISDRLLLSDVESSKIASSSLTDLGMSSLMAVEIVNQISKDLDIQIDVGQLLKINSFESISDYIINLKWLSSKVAVEGEELVI